jgi:hypothetical protein
VQNVLSYLHGIIKASNIVPILEARRSGGNAPAPPSQLHQVRPLPSLLLLPLVPLLVMRLLTPVAVCTTTLLRSVVCSLAQLGPRKCGVCLPSVGTDKSVFIHP